MCFCSGVIRGVKDYGMPLHKHPELRGNLYVEFEIEFPESMGSKEVEVSLYSFYYTTCPPVWEGGP